jgi:hypothetical protein
MGLDFKTFQISNFGIVNFFCAGSRIIPFQFFSHKIFFMKKCFNLIVSNATIVQVEKSFIKIET